MTDDGGRNEDETRSDGEAPSDDVVASERERRADVRVLCTAADTDALERTTASLERESDRIDATAVTTPADALDVLETGRIDCVVSDYRLPGTTGVALLDRVRAAHGDLPFVLFTGEGDERIASEAISAGVTEYLRKGSRPDQYAALADHVERVVGENRARAAPAGTGVGISTSTETPPPVAYRRRADRDWSMEFVGEGCRALTGYEPDAFTSGAVAYREVVHPDDRRSVGEAVEERVDAGERFELAYRIRRRDGELRWVSDRGRGVSEDGELVALEGVLSDCTAIADRAAPGGDHDHDHDLADGIVGACPVGIALLSPTGEVRRANDRAGALLDAPTEGAECTRIDDLSIADEEGERLPTGETPFARVLETGEPVRGRTVRIDPEDGEGRWLSVHAAPLGDGDGPGAVVALADVTERRERRRDLERTTELYETTLANIRDTVLITDDEGRFTYVCPNVSHIFGYDPGTVRDLGTVDALLGEDLFDPADLERTGELRNLETTVTDSEGRDRVVLVTAKRVAIEEGTVLYSVREITERKERERRFEAIFDRTFQFMGLLEPDGTVVEINETALAFAGVDREAVVGRPAWETDWWRVDRPTRRRLRDAVGRAGDGEFVRFDAEIEGCESTATVDCSIRPITDDEEVVLLVAEGRDITDHKRQERELERQNERLEEFASVVSHDLRNPLTVAQGSLELAREEGAPAHFDRVESAHDRMHALIEDLLTVAREGQRVEETSPVALDSLVESTWAGVPSGDATLEVAFESYRLEADEARLRQLLENLLSNAVEYGGEDVTVRVGLLDEDGFYVADDGPGIPPLQRETVFDHGFSTGEAGTGFGLSIVEGIAEAHGWSVAATGSADGGARFEVIVDRPGQSSAREDRPPG